MKRTTYAHAGSRKAKYSRMPAVVAVAVVAEEKEKDDPDSTSSCKNFQPYNTPTSCPRGEVNEQFQYNVRDQTTPSTCTSHHLASEENLTDSSQFHLQSITAACSLQSVKSSVGEYADSLGSSNYSFKGSSSLVDSHPEAMTSSNHFLQIYVGDDSSSMDNSESDANSQGAVNGKKNSVTKDQNSPSTIINVPSAESIHSMKQDSENPRAAMYAQNLNLPLDNPVLKSDHLSPISTGGGASPTGSMRRENGSSTPRLRISTPKTTQPVGGPAVPGGPHGANANSDGPAKSMDALEKKVATEIRSGPSSRRTVVIIAGLFVVGLILILSGIIVLSVEEHTAFQIAGGIFLGSGIVFFIICLILQKKNVKKLVNELEKDLFFLNVTDNKIWNFIFHFDEQLTWS